MVGKYYLSCDIGTSVTKTVLFDDDFKTVSSASEENSYKNTKACWLEEYPEQWWSSVVREIISATKGIDTRNVLGIATCAQMHAPILVDFEGNSLFPCLSWPDSRTIKLVDEIARETGVPQPYFTSTAPKILWIKRNFPEILEKTYKILLPKDFIRMKLSGTFCTDTSDAQGTAMYDSDNKIWNEKIVNYLGINNEKLPEVYPSEKIVGAVNEKASKLTGLAIGIPVCTGTGDFGIGRRLERTKVAPTNILLYLGTGPGIWWIPNEKTTGLGSRSTVSILGVAGHMPQWFKNTYCQEDILQAEKQGINVFDLLSSEAEKIEPGVDGLICLPHLMGERSYGGRTWGEDGRLNPYARGVFYGLCMGHTRYHMFRAILEGISYHLKLCWEHIQASNPGITSSQIVVTGGGAKSKLWRKILADTFNLPVSRLQELETSTLGLACILSVSIGKNKDFEEAASKVDNPITDTVLPDPTNVTRYSEMFELYKRLELNLEPIFTPNESNKKN